MHSFLLAQAAEYRRVEYNEVRPQGAIIDWPPTVILHRVLGAPEVDPGPEILT